MITPLPLKRIIVLGASGFVGKRVVAALAARDIMVIPLASRDLDLTSASAVDQITKLIAPEDDILFISALTPDRGRDVHTLMKNLSMAYHLSHALFAHPCRHLSYVSSDAVYLENASLIHEATPCDPQSLHGVMHITREKVLADAARHAKVPFLALRPCALYGAGDTHNSYGPNRFMTAARRDREISLFGAGEERRAHLFIDDCAELIVRAIVARCTGALNLAPPTTHSFMEVAQMVKSAIGSEIALKTTPRQGPVTHRSFDITALMKQFPDFVFTTLSAGISRSLSS